MEFDFKKLQTALYGLCMVLMIMLSYQLTKTLTTIQQLVASNTIHTRQNSENSKLIAKNNELTMKNNELIKEHADSIENMAKTIKEMQKKEKQKN